MAEIAPVARQQAYKLGISAPSARLYTYLSGTSTPQVVYLDAARTTPAANPLVADSTGLFPAFWLADVAYRFTLKDSADVTIWGPVDGISHTVLVTVGQGGTGATTFTDGGVLVGNGTGAIQATSAGTAGQVLTSTGAGSDPTFQAAPTTAGITTDGTRVQQIAFAATQVPSADANTLDDYEEGPWTPTDASGAGLAITNNGSGFIKAGQLVTVWSYLTYPATANGANSLIGGLPYTSSSTLFASAVVGWTDSATPIAVHIPTSATAIEFITTTSVARRTNAQMSSIAVRFTIQYRAAA